MNRLGTVSRKTKPVLLKSSRIRDFKMFGLGFLALLSATTWFITNTEQIDLYVRDIESEKRQLRHILQSV